jgi:RNA polymerase sigma factor (sigma-70 family)
MLARTRARKPGEAILSSSSQAWTREQLDRVVAGDAQAVRLFVRDLGVWFRGLVRKHFRLSGIPPDEDEDFLQELIVELFRDHARVLCEWDPRKGASLKTYLSSRVDSRLIDWRRRQQSKPVRSGGGRERDVGPSLLDHKPAHGASPAEHAELVELVRHMEASCTSEERLIFAKLVLDDQPAKDVAEEMNLSLDTVNQRKSRLVRRLQQLWRRLQGEE